MIQNFQDYTAECQSEEDATIKEKVNSGLAPITEPQSNEGSFECNICFDLAHDPVVTLCGHLYCWACIFKWLHVQISSSQSTQEKTCPVCKANISQSSLVPLYCHGPSLSEDERRMSHYDAIPPRPNASGVNSLISADPPSNQLPVDSFESNYPGFRFGNYPLISNSNFVSTTMAGIINPTIELLGELIYTRLSRSGDTDASLLTIPLLNSYSSVGRGNPRIRRQELQVEKSLHRVSTFLFFCVVLCWLFF